MKLQFLSWLVLVHGSTRLCLRFRRLVLQCNKITVALCIIGPIVRERATLYNLTTCLLVYASHFQGYSLHNLYQFVMSVCYSCPCRFGRIMWVCGHLLVPWRQSTAAKNIRRLATKFWVRVSVTGVPRGEGLGGFKPPPRESSQFFELCICKIYCPSSASRPIYSLNPQFSTGKR